MAPRQNNPKLPPYGVLAASHSHTKDFKTSPHAHKYPSLFYVIAGKGALLIPADKTRPARQIELTQDSALLLKENLTHQIIDRPRNPMTLFVIYFASPLPHERHELIEITPLYEKLISPRSYTAEHIRKQLRNILNEQSQKLPCYQAAITYSLCDIMVNLMRASAKNPADSNSSKERVKAILEYVKHNFSQPYSLGDAAIEAGLSERHFTNICRELTGMSFRRYVEKLRLERAKRLLETTAMPAAAIAFEVGYEELSSFYRAFKSHLGISPIAYRNGITA